MADNWDDILAEPIASLSDPTAAAPVDADSGVEEHARRLAGRAGAARHLAALAGRPGDHAAMRPTCCSSS